MWNDLYVTANQGIVRSLVQRNKGANSAYDRAMSIDLSLLVAVFGVVAQALAQTDGLVLAGELRAKYGPPLARETFAIPAGEMIVDYSANGRVCRIDLPATAPEERRPEVRSAKGMDDFLLGLIPLAQRGKELKRLVTSIGLASVSAVEYQHLTISHVSQGQRQTGITVTFANEVCRDPLVQ
jgi:hypothetical protein